jgi:hypothetical protein
MWLPTPLARLPVRALPGRASTVAAGTWGPRTNALSCISGDGDEAEEGAGGAQGGEAEERQAAVYSDDDTGLLAWDGEELVRPPASPSPPLLCTACAFYGRGCAAACHEVAAVRLWEG